MLHEVLVELVIILGAAVAVLLASWRLRVPSVVGLLLTGVLLGPAGLGVIREGPTISGLAELGVVFLLFSIGLDLSLEELAQVRRAFFFAAPLYVALAVGATAALALALGSSPGAAVFFGFLVALSSTAVVFKLLAEARELGTPHGRLVVGICLFQDFLLVPMLVLIPALGGVGSASGWAIGGRLLAGVAAAAALFYTARRVMPWILERLARTGLREGFVLGSLAVCLGAALATHALGLSLALGAFAAGLLLSESHFGHQVVADVSPLRDVFNSLFFVSIGMLLRREAVLELWPAVVGATIVVILLKALSGLGAAALAGFPQRTGVLAALALAQIGEFSFVLAGEGRRYGLLGDGELQIFLAAAILSLLLTPALVAAGPRLAVVARRLGLPGGTELVGERAAVEERADHVVIVGFGVGGRQLARVLREASIRYVVVELAGEVARAARAEGEPVLFGDATRTEILRQAGVERARVAVFAISDRDAVRRAVIAARALAPRLVLVVRTRRVADLETLSALGADEVVAEEFESSIELFARVLAHYHVPRHVIDAQERVLRGDSYRGLRSALAGEQVSAAVLEALAAGTVDVFRVTRGTRAAGRTIRELEVRRATGATILALVREGAPLSNPSPDQRLEAGDSLVLVGSHAEIEHAFRLLDRPESDGTRI